MKKYFKFYKLIFYKYNYIYLYYIFNIINKKKNKIYILKKLNILNKKKYIYLNNKIKKNFFKKKKYKKIRKEFDHRILYKKNNLFFFKKKMPGLIFWNKNGYIIWKNINKYIRNNIYIKYNYKEIKTPIILRDYFWKKTKHWNYYKKNMFLLKTKNKKYALKPMNCPGHIQIYNYKKISYKKLPLKYGEIGECFRNEYTGSLHGILRLKNFNQDDGHIFCKKNQILLELIKFNNICKKVYKNFNFKNIKIKLSLRPKKKIGNNYLWNLSEKILLKIILFFNIKIKNIEKNGAFYGPKIEYYLKDLNKKIWQCGTIQIDFIISKILNLNYNNKYNIKKNIIILHRAILGSIERFIGILIENNKGYIPFYLIPIQIVIININNKILKYTNNIIKILKKNKFRIKKIINNNNLSLKLKKYFSYKSYFCILIGNKENKKKSIFLKIKNNINLGFIKIKKFIFFLNIIKKNNI
ncbi:putative threonyl-tRNA synthetase [Candidatus Zinderia insecticola CARI]|uniref:threonine--tRNA ligase n=1 Tax=Zinderia insecticola (strain CARI) TaxID=871271 RepID=E0TIN2_ZINIC|nr:putative threonyl-tRNA synthetase [Candidatus Zinderia insecticola CARI]